MTQPPPGGSSGGEPPAEENESLPARLGEERLTAPVVRTGMFGVEGTPDTSGYGGLQVLTPPPLASEPPYGGDFHAGGPALRAAPSGGGRRFGGAVEPV